MQKFINRAHAGQLLADKLIKYKNAANTLILALPRGGVPVAFEVAKKLNLPLDVFIVRKLGMPGHEELAMGAIAYGNVTVFNDDVLSSTAINSEVMAKVIAKEQQELSRRNRLYRNNKPIPNFNSHNIIIIDDGLATGATMRAAITALKKFNPARLVVAVPVAPTTTCEQLRNEVDEFVCLLDHEPFYGVGMWYGEFPQISDNEVCNLLASAEKYIK